MSRVVLFGEMEVDFSETPEQFLKRAFKTAEACGYVVEVQNQHAKGYKEQKAYNIAIYGEDFNDNADLINYVNIYDGKISSLQKVIYSSTWKNKYEGNDSIEPYPIQTKTMHKVYKYNKSIKTWDLFFDCDKLRKETKDKTMFVKIEN